MNEGVDRDEVPNPPRTAERLLVERLGELIGDRLGDRVLCGTAGRAQLAAAWARAAPHSRVVCNFLDLYQAQQASLSVGELSNLELTCEPDPPAEEFDVVALPLSAHGDGELTRELLQTGHQVLRVGRTLWAATDNPRDRWLRGELERLFDRVSCWPKADGTVYRAVKRGPLKKVKSFAAEYVFRDRERLLTVWSRPGVFSHRHIDAGSRALIEVMEVAAGERVVDLGCGAGVVGLAAAARAGDVSVLALDSNPRAIQCVKHSATLNRLERIEARIDADVSSPLTAEFDVVLANPPYFSRHRIATIFVTGAARALRPGGRLWLVTKDPQWYVDHLPHPFEDVTVVPSRAYAVVSARRA